MSLQKFSEAMMAEPVEALMHRAAAPDVSGNLAKSLVSAQKKMKHAHLDGAIEIELLR